MTLQEWKYTLMLLEAILGLAFMLYILIRLLFIKDKKRRPNNPGRGGGDFGNANTNEPSPPWVDVQLPVPNVEKPIVSIPDNPNGLPVKHPPVWSPPIPDYSQKGTPVEMPQEHPIEWGVVIHEYTKKE